MLGRVFHRVERGLRFGTRAVALPPGPLAVDGDGEAPCSAASGVVGPGELPTRPWLILVSLLGCTPVRCRDSCHVSFTLRPPPGLLRMTARERCTLLN